MDKICKEYIKDVKRFFPVFGKQEKKYLEGLKSELEDCIEREGITDRKELYTKYSQPYDVVKDYYESCDTREIIKKIDLTKYISVLLAAIVLVGIVVGVTYLSAELHRSIIESREQLIVSEGEIIKDEIIDDEIIEDEIIEDEVID